MLCDRLQQTQVSATSISSTCISVADVLFIIISSAINSISISTLHEKRVKYQKLMANVTTDFSSDEGSESEANHS
ncbi:hypothetical protein MJO28_015473 [Puccinia striiformis f. sp. tritici]|uniref:Uncharacterized protein n=1 Tax=Puccinia striiformis f. sp. tritici TaxID=168172 RepID=A0ACC0DSQ3_9BASI|nr:hypothetical protein MJO28_015473 [Puccinia striiformis f. sp. tritici]